jgi:hypothetical protein
MACHRAAMSLSNARDRSGRVSSAASCRHMRANRLYISTGLAVIPRPEPPFRPPKQAPNPLARVSFQAIDQKAPSVAVPRFPLGSVMGLSEKRPATGRPRSGLRENYVSPSAICIGAGERILVSAGKAVPRYAETALIRSESRSARSTSSAILSHCCALRSQDSRLSEAQDCSARRRH